jgi:aspartyl-tRNA(Asn)/glutamyl-tRNA(Gln) amidotransferase subunit A
MELTDLTIAEAHEGLKSKKFSAVDLTRAYLEKIKKSDKEIHAYLSVDEDSALAQAHEADKKIAAGDCGELTGIPLAVKDNILWEGQQCTAASKMLENYVAPYDATIIKKLKDAGAIFLGKTNLDEFAMGSSTENSAFGATKNPHDITRVPGGSSGGSGAAVAAKEALFALGTDTGGSIRQPASLCGVVGLKPTYGAVSRYGLIAFASSLDQAGPLTKTVGDAKIVFKAIAGKDPMDATSAEYVFEEKDVSMKGLRIGVPKEYFSEGLDKQVEQVVRQAIEKAKAAGAEIVEISLPSTEYALACYYIIAPSEASANLSRYDGIKYGLSVPGKDLLDVYLKSKGQGFGEEVKRRIMIGTYTLSSGYYDAYYKKAQEVRERIRQDFKQAFEKVDVIMGPTSPTTAFKIGEKTDDPLSMYLADIYTVSINIAGIPALSMPAGKVDGLPVGLQIIGNYFEENTLFSVAEQMENMLQYIK